MSRGALTQLLFLATLFCVTFEKVRWEIAGTVTLADVLTIFFLAAFALSRLRAADLRLSRTAVTVLGFLAAFLLVYLLGFFNLDTAQALTQYGKGMVKFGLHFLFLAAAVAYLARRSRRFYWTCLGAFAGGMLVNSVYGVLQLLAARAGFNLDQTLLSPLTGGASSIHRYGAVEGRNVYRPNALTGDPNHLGIMLALPLLVLAPLYLRLGRGHALKAPLAVVLGFLLLVELATLSRSGALALLVGALVLALPYRRLFVSRAALLPLGGVAALVGYVVYRSSDFFATVIRSRLQTGGRSTSTHLGVYEFVPDVLSTHPLFGLGLNNFSVYYQFVTGRTNWGPHSFYVALIVETGLVGTLLFAVFVWWLVLRLRAAHAVGRALAVARDPLAARVRPLAWGLTAALAGTIAANAFYLTMQFYYFYAFAALLLAAPIVFGRAAATRSPSTGMHRPATTIGGVT